MWNRVFLCYKKKNDTALNWKKNDADSAQLVSPGSAPHRRLIQNSPNPMRMIKILNILMSKPLNSQLEQRE